jgi:hypothetical protein
LQEGPTACSCSENTIEKINGRSHNGDHITAEVRNKYSNALNYLTDPGLNNGEHRVVEPGCQDVPACFVSANEENICDKHMTVVCTYHAYIIQSDTYPHMNYIATKLYSDGSNVPSVHDWLMDKFSLKMVTANGPFLIYYMHNKVIPANASVLLYADGWEWNSEFTVFHCALKDSHLVNMRMGDEKHSWAAVKK